MKAPVSLLIVHGDGSGMVRLCLPRWVAHGALAFVVGAVATAVGVSGDYVVVRQRSAQVPELRRHVADQQHLIGAFQARVATVRGEIMVLKALHEQMWNALGPETGANDQATGIGGASSTGSTLSPAAGLRPLAELDLLAAHVAEEASRLREMQDAISRTGEIMSAIPLRWPLRGPVNAEYGQRRSPWTGKPEQHDGVDIGAAPGTPVEAPAVGRVVAAGSAGDLGNHIALDHGNGVRTLYGHLREIDVRVGQRVAKGQTIGLAGSTGRSTGPHLHYEVRVEGKPIDPRRFLWEP